VRGPRASQMPGSAAPAQAHPELHAAHLQVAGRAAGQDQPGRAAAVQTRGRGLGRKEAERAARFCGPAGLPGRARPHGPAGMCMYVAIMCVCMYTYMLRPN
jgi:hypothetical protein